MKKTVVQLNDMATTFIGSVVLMACCFEPEYNSDEFKQKMYWKYTKMSKNPFGHFKTIEDTWNIEKILEAFELVRTWDWPVCLVTSDKGCLLCPYATDEDKIIPLSPRPDGFPVYTIRKPESIQLINWSKDEEVSN